YGHGMRVKDARQTFLGIWIRRLIEGKPIQIFGDGKQRRDFNFVTDVVEALLRAAASREANGQVFNLGHYEQISLQELASLLVEISGGGDYELVPFPDERKAIDIGDYYADFRKIGKLVGWSPKVSLDDGLKQTLEYYRKHHAHYWDSIDTGSITADDALPTAAPLHTTGRVVLHRPSALTRCPHYTARWSSTG